MVQEVANKSGIFTQRAAHHQANPQQVGEPVEDNLEESETEGLVGTPEIIGPSLKTFVQLPLPSAQPSIIPCLSPSQGQCHAPSQLNLEEPSHMCIHLTMDHDLTQLNTLPHMGNVEYSPTWTSLGRQGWCVDSVHAIFIHLTYNTLCFM